jgi:hypothetical protein
LNYSSMNCKVMLVCTCLFISILLPLCLVVQSGSIKGYGLKIPAVPPDTNNSHREFRNPTNFSYSVYNSPVNADFSSSTFRCKADFSFSTFKAKANFLGAHFDSSADFSKVKFSSEADFSAAAFNSVVSFKYASLPDTLWFENVKEIQDEIDLTVARIDTLKTKDKNYKCKIDLFNSDISKIRINYVLFQLCFPPDKTFEQKMSTYEKLLKKFKDEGFLESYKLLDVEYQDFIYKQNKNVILNCFLKNWWNYGYNKEYVLTWSLFIFVLFYLLNIFLFNHLQKNVFEIDFAFYNKSNSGESVQNISSSGFSKAHQRTLTVKRKALITLNNLAIRVINPLIYTGVIFFGLTISLEKFKKFSGWAIYIWLIYLIGLFCLAYIINIIIVK